ncbi:hypothetical protein RUND412_002188 [Rhizina undulata]
MAYLHPYSTSPLSEQQSIPKLRLKPSPSKLRSKKSSTSSIIPLTPSKIYHRNREDSTSPLSSSSAGNVDTSIQTRKDRRPTALLKAMAPTTVPSVMPIAPSRSKTTSPPTKHHAVFSIAGSSSSKDQSSVTSSGYSSSDKTSSSEKKTRHVIRRKNSSTSFSAFALGSLRSGSTSSINGSTASLTTSNSGASKNVPHSSILGITMPPTSASSQASLYNSTPRSASRAHSRVASASYVITNLQTRDLPLPINISNVNGDTYDSSASTRFTESPGNLTPSSTPTSASPHSPAFRLWRSKNSSPSRPPLTWNLPRGLSGLDGEGSILDSVRESTTSTSSGSTIRAPVEEREEIREEIERDYTRSLSPPSFSYHPSGVSSAPNTPFYPALTMSPSPPQFISKSTSPMSSRKKGSTSIPLHPSRDGTPELHMLGLGVTIPIIQRGVSPTVGSNGMPKRTRSKSLSTSAFPQRQRKESSATLPLPSPGLPPASQPRKNSIPRGPTPQPTDPVNLVGFPYHTIPPPSRSQIGGISVLKRGEKEKVSRDPSPSRSPAKIGRTGFFSSIGRRVTGDEEKEKEKASRKGPAAGTGHEAYSAFSRRGRSGSTGGSNGSTGSYVRSGSQSSASGSWGRKAGSRAGSRGSKADMEMDDYLLDRLKPVVMIGGGEVVENLNFPGGDISRVPSSLGFGADMSRSGSGQGSVDMGRNASSQGFQKRQHSPVVMSREGSREGSSRAPSRMAMGRDLEKETVASRRAQIASRRTPTPIPQPINTSGQRPPPTGIPPNINDVTKAPECKEGATASYSAFPKIDRRVTPPAEHQVSPALASDPFPAPVKTKRWNFLQRSQPSNQRQPASAPPPVTPTPTSSSPRKVSTKRQPHYALLDEEERKEAAQLMEQMQELRQRNALKKRDSAQTMSIVLPDPPQPLPKQETEIVNPEFIPEKKPERGKLQQIGKIPVVGTVRIATPPQTPKHDTSLKVSTGSPRAPPVPKKQTQLLPPLQTRLPQGVFEDIQVASAPPRIGNIFNGPAEEFQIDWEGYGLTPTAATPGGFEGTDQSFNYDPLDVRGRPVMQISVTPVAVKIENDDTWPIRKTSVPTTNIIAATPIGTDEGEREENNEDEDEEDDEWHEYDDFLQDSGLFFGDLEENEPISTETRAARTRSTTSSLGSPFQYSDLIQQFPDLKNLREEKTQKQEAIEVNVNDSPTIPPTLPAKVVPSPLPLITRASPLNGTSEFPPPQNSQRMFTPNTAFSFSSFIRYYADNDSRLLEPLTARLMSGNGETSARKTHKSNGSNGSNNSHNSGSSRGSGAGGSSVGDPDENEMKVRLWALMTSRYLSFDRVLVSPAHERLQNINNGGGVTSGGRILIVDGLGTDDWSYYCALTYPSAKVYNLSSSHAAPTISGSMTPTSPTVTRPSNHMQIHHPNFATTFPFPKGFFNVVSFRFLPSSSDSNLPLILSECKRVMEPGGYLEVTVLDAELINTGNRARKAVDLVKAIMQRENESRSRNPKAMSEKVLKVLERRGFENISKCFVGLPVVGKINGSMSGSIDSRDDGIERDVAPDPLPEDPESMNEVVSKVGRWWYTRCYERVITGEGEMPGRSMWNDKALLRECARKKTTFKMLVCHARKPVGSVRMANMPMI